MATNATPSTVIAAARICPECGRCELEPHEVDQCSNCAGVAEFEAFINRLYPPELLAKVEEG